MAVDKISEEWTVMRYFREKHAAFPKGKLVKSESPDFVLRVNRKKQIGIELTSFDYQADKAGSMGELFHKLSHLIRQKEAKLSIYRKKKLNEYWLIISVDSFEKSVIDKIKEDAPLTDHTQFNCVFLFDLFSGRIAEIR